MRAPFALRVLAACVDLGWMFGLHWFLLAAPGAPPFPTAPLIAVWILTAAAARTISCASLSGTPGQLACGLRLTDSTGERLTGLVAARAAWGLQRGAFAARPETPRKLGLATAALFALAGVLLNIAGGLAWLRSQPLAQKAFDWNVQATPAIGDPFFRRSWAPLPFYYAIGLWPKRFDGNPVFFSLPYTPGPPKQFPARVISRWHDPGVRLTLEGPRTPEGGTDAASLASRLKSCLLEGRLGGGCAGLKALALGPHVEKMRRVSPKRWYLRWFEVRNPALPESERPRGVYLAAEGVKRAQERYLLVLPSGSIQPLILDRPSGPGGERARADLEITVSGLRIAPDLNSGRAMIEQALADIRLEDLRQLRDSLSFAARLSEIQAMLIAQITVQPANLNAYYHLGGLSLMLLQHATELRTARTQLVPPDVLVMLDRWTAAARPMIKAAARFAKDVSPDDPKTERLQNLWLEAQKL
ncbi:MAG: hypothetical protein IT285_04520 [Bdellovibrionales bacterium]|nr:hypothetical protein [Bdellovibrionales bacterium]